MHARRPTLLQREFAAASILLCARALRWYNAIQAIWYSTIAEPRVLRLLGWSRELDVVGNLELGGVGVQVSTGALYCFGNGAARLHGAGPRLGDGGSDRSVFRR